MEVLKELACREEQVSLASLIDLAIHLDNLFQNYQVYQESLSTAGSLDFPDPIQITCTKLSHMEHKMRRSKSLCYYCSSSDHAVAGCPEWKKAASPPKPAESATSSSNTTVLSPFQFLTLQSFMLSVQIIHVFIFPALTESGASANFINDNHVQLKFPMQNLQHPLRISTIDGGHTGSGTITLCTSPHIIFQRQIGAIFSETISFLVTITAKRQIILSFPWMHHHDPQISWQEKELTKWSEHCIIEFAIHISSLPQLRWRVPRKNISKRLLNKDMSDYPHHQPLPSSGTWKRKWEDLHCLQGFLEVGSSVHLYMERAVK